MKHLNLFFFIAIFGFIIFTDVTSANDKQGMFVSYGVKECESVISLSEKLIKESDQSSLDIQLHKISGHPELHYLHGWLLGFATAINSSIHGPPNFFKGMKEFEIIKWTVNWCKKNPGGTIDTAIRKLATQPKP